MKVATCMVQEHADLPVPVTYVHTLVYTFNNWVYKLVHPLKFVVVILISLINHCRHSCTCGYFSGEYLVLEVSVKSEIGAAL